MKVNQELNLKIEFKTDSEMSDFETATDAILNLLENELNISLVDD